MKRLIPAVLVFALTGCFQCVLAQDMESSTKVANRLLELINAADYSGVENLFNKDMSKALPLPKATEFFAGMTGQFGSIQKLDAPRRNGGWTVFPAHFERGMLDLSIVLDDENRIAGLTFKPSRKTRSAANSTPATGIAAICKEHNVPALAVVVTKDGQICDHAAAGIRKWGNPTPVTTNDVWHIGSCTKSMTATLAAIFIEQGKLRWDTTIAEVFPEWKGKMDKRYETVTVEQLLHHRGGVPHDPPSAAWKRAWQEIGTPMQQRREFVESVLRAPPEAEPGTKMIYSNQGYVFVGAMLEKISDQDFESLMTEKLFKPLQMDTASFGPPGTKGQIDQPWGHVQKLSQTVPVQSDNPPVLSPAGRVHCSLDDLARYAMFHLQPGANALLKPETMARLHASPEGVEIKNVMDDYACGWVRMKRDWAGGTVLWHNGSNTMWYLVMWLAPEKNFSVIAATNIAGDNAEKACDEACVAMIHKWLPE